MFHPSLVKGDSIPLNLSFSFQLESLREHQQSAASNRRTSPLLTVHSIEEDGDCVDGAGATARWAEIARQFWRQSKRQYWRQYWKIETEIEIENYAPLKKAPKQYKTLVVLLTAAITAVCPSSIYQDLRAWVRAPPAEGGEQATRQWEHWAEGTGK